MRSPQPLGVIHKPQRNGFGAVLLGDSTWILANACKRRYAMLLGSPLTIVNGSFGAIYLSNKNR
jgi:hypothetical protein